MSERSEDTTKGLRDYIERRIHWTSGITILELTCYNTRAVRGTRKTCNMIFFFFGVWANVITNTQHVQNSQSTEKNK